MKLSLALVALAVAPALADPAPRAPDFTGDVPLRGVDRANATSHDTAEIAPSDDLVFANDSAALDADGQATLGLAAHWLATHPTAHLVVVAHADQPGTAEHNDALSYHRGQVVRDYLVSAGAAGDRVVVVACGARGEAERRAELYASFAAATDTAESCGRHSSRDVR